MEETLWNTTLLSDLPVEILELILSFDEISFRDVCRFSQVCSLFKYVGSSNKLWKTKYKNKWLRVMPLIDRRLTDWKEQFRYRHTFNKRISDALSEMSQNYYLFDNMSNDAFAKFHRFSDNPISTRMLIDELERIVHDGRSSENLTKKYYAKRALRYVRHMCLKDTWQNFFKAPPQMQCLEVGASLLSQWCQPTHFYSTAKVMRQLDAMAKRVKEKVEEVSPSHPVLKIDLVKEPYLAESMWSPGQCRIILQCINDYLFREHKFTGNRNDYCCADNTYIDKVLIRRTGIPISLGILYAAIARRLGVACLPVNFLGHFLLKWREHPNYDDSNAFTYIDVHDKGVFRTRTECFEIAPGYQPFADSFFEEVPPIKVYIRMCWNLVEVGRRLEGIGDGLMCLCDALELLSILNPDDPEHKLLLARVYLHLCINIREVISLIQEVSANDPTSSGVVTYMYRAALSHMEAEKCRTHAPQIVAKTRDKDCPVKFAVGMIMKHMKYNYRCVIHAWDTECMASQDWMTKMGVHTLAFRDKQPFYYVLANDGSNRYAAQENLEIDLECKPIFNPDVGRYFEAYRGPYYAPNEQKIQEYPDDAAVRDSLFSYGEYFMYKDKSPFTNSVSSCFED